MAVRKKEDATRVLGDVSGDKRFFCHDGCIASNLQQLAECLSHMDEQSYNHHVTGEKNDFSNWVRDVFGDHRLANELARSRNKDEAIRVLTGRIAWLKRKLR
jgi:hypothetical protein